MYMYDQHTIVVIPDISCGMLLCCMHNSCTYTWACTHTHTHTHTVTPPLPCTHQHSILSSYKADWPPSVTHSSTPLFTHILSSTEPRGPSKGCVDHAGRLNTKAWFTIRRNAVTQLEYYPSLTLCTRARFTYTLHGTHCIVL